jgi:hypothetical protein
MASVTVPGGEQFLTENCNIFKSFDQKVSDSHCQTKITQNLWLKDKKYQ